MLAGRGSYPGTSTEDCCTGRHPRQVWVYSSDNRNPPQCPYCQLSSRVILSHLDYHGPHFVRIALHSTGRMVFDSQLHGKFLGALCP